MLTGGGSIVPDALREVADDEHFWSSYYSLDHPRGRGDFARLGATLLEFNPMPDTWFRVEWVRGAWQAGLYLDGPNGRVLVGQDYRAREESDFGQLLAGEQLWALRVDEVELLGRAIEVFEPTLPHPGIPLLLLLRFAPTTVAEEAELAVASCQSALGRVCPSMSAERRERFAQCFDQRGLGLRWSRGERGWVCENPNLPGFEVSSRQPSAELEEILPLVSDVLSAMGPQRVAQIPEVRGLLQPRSTGGPPLRSSTLLNEAERLVLSDAMELAGLEEGHVLESLRTETDEVRLAWLLEWLENAPTGSRLPAEQRARARRLLGEAS